MKKLPRVLFIDDDEDDVEFHEIVVKRTGAKVNVLSVTDPRKALDCWVNGCDTDDDVKYPVPEIVFLDINMPALSGFDLLDRMKKVADPYQRRKNMSIFMLTNSQNPEDHKLATERHGDLVKGFCSKPLTGKAFLDILQDLGKTG
jgi:CheY-like chemotaxis protein